MTPRVEGNYLSRALSIGIERHTMCSKFVKKGDMTAAGIIAGNVVSEAIPGSAISERPGSEGHLLVEWTR
jgi:hypothetical protein